MSSIISVDIPFTRNALDISLKNTIFRQPNTPTTATEGDFWIYSGTDGAYPPVQQYVNGLWVEVDGLKGDEGIPGQPGTDGSTTYLHIAYADTETGTGFSQDPTGKEYMGTYVDFVQADSSDPSKYTWVKVKGDTGAQGIEGPPGQDGQTLYTWVKYADSPTTGMSDDPTGKTYMGIAYNKTTQIESTNYADYAWSLTEGQGVQGPAGQDGQTFYTWIKYATTPTTGMSDSPTGKIYMGIAYNKTTSTESTNYADYSWSLIKGDKGDKGDAGPQGPAGVDGLQGPQGDQGIQGPTGADGVSSYTHIAYATNSTGTTGFSTSDSVGKTYIGMYVDNVQNDSTDPTKYKWSLIKGADGSQGIQGPTGTDGKTSYLHIAYATNSTGTTGFSTTVSLGKTYIGQYTDFVSADSTDPTKYLWTLIKGDKGDTGPQGPSGLQGVQGDKGDQGIQGPKGVDGVSSYTHIAYATNSTGTAGFSVSDSVGKTYIGMYVDTIATDSTDPTKYKWSLIKGADGSQGIQGPAGTNGQTPYLHIAYSTSSTGSTGFSTTDPVGKTFIGTYTDFVSADSTDPTKYAWSLIKGDKGDTGPQGSQGIQGPKGADGVQLYTWLKYADSPTTGMSDTPTGKKYMGIAYNKTSQTESSVYSDYSWSLIEGSQGIQGPKGTDGVTTYTWVKYADDAIGTGLSDSPEGKRYLGLAYNKTTTTESSTASDYTWSPLYDNVKVGGRNILPNSTFNKGIEPWSGSSMSSWSIVDPEADKPNSHIIKISKSGNSQNWYYQLWSPPMQIDADGTKEITLSFDIKATSVAAIDSTKIIFDVRTFDDTTSTAGSAAVWEKNIKVTDMTLIDNTWLRYKITYKPTGGKYIRVAPYLVMNGEVFWREIQLENGNVDTDYTPAIEDKENLYTWVKYATDSVGTGLSDSPTGKTYIGFAYNKDTATESTNPLDYAWSLIKGDKGDTGSAGSTGPQGPKGETGLTGPRGPEADDSMLFGKNSDFYDWTGSLPAGYTGLTGTAPVKVASDNSSGNAAQWTVADGIQGYMNKQVTNVPYSQYLHLEVTFKLTSGTIDSAGVLIRMEATADSDTRIDFKDYVPDPVLNKWYTITEVIKLPSATIPAGYTGYTIYPMGAWASFRPITAKTIQFDSVRVRPATQGERYGFENGLLVNGWVKTGTTIIDGGKISADVIDVVEANVDELSALSANLGTITAGEIIGVLMNLAGGKFIVDAAGNVKVKGDITGSTGTFSGDVSGGTITADGVGTGKFMYTNALDINPSTAGVNIYVRPKQDGELRITKTGTIDVYEDLRCALAFLDGVALNNGTNFYIGVDAIDGELRVTDRSLGAGGSSAIHYRPLRASGLYSTFIQVNPYVGDATHLYLRSARDSEVRITDSDTTDQYGALRAAGLYSAFIETNTAAGAATHLYLRSPSSAEIRATNSGTTDAYSQFRAAGFIGNTLDFNELHGAGTHIYIRPKSGGEVRATVKGGTDTYVPMRASSFPTGSMAEYKQDITEWEDSALDLIESATIYEYRLRSEVDQGIDRVRQGLVIGADYNTPKGVIDGDGVEQYLMNSWSWKGIKELIAKDRAKDEKIAEQEVKITAQDQKINNLEQRLAALEAMLNK
jgi:hypothetical protein